ncbi:MAG: hypothetical protein CUN55_05640 [Phototrophicales bacterium]|nr:MAG: hypothetical protein CUN55_05640 [Phototrophicales bacterium]
MRQTQPRTAIHANWLMPTLHRLWQINPQPLQQLGLNPETPQLWYELETWLQLLELLPQYGISAEQVGVIMGRTYPFSRVESIAAVLTQLGEDYVRTHNEPADCWRVCEQGPRMVCVTTRTPYPDDFELGLIRTAAERFAPPQTSLNIQQFHSTPRLIAYNTRTYLITW